MKIPCTITPTDFTGILKQLDADGTPWEFRGSSDGTLHLYIDGNLSKHRVKLESYGSWTAHSELVALEADA